MIELNLDEYVEPIKVKMGGHIFTFRELGAINELALAQAQSRATRLAGKPKLTSAEEDELRQLTQKVYDMALSMFDDGVGGKITVKILGNLSQDKLRQLREKIVAEYKAGKAVENE